jgi:hypothetical protein
MDFVRPLSQNPFQPSALTVGTRAAFDLRAFLTGQGHHWEKERAMGHRLKIKGYLP